MISLDRLLWRDWSLVIVATERLLEILSRVDGDLYCAIALDISFEESYEITPKRYPYWNLSISNTYIDHLREIAIDSTTLNDDICNKFWLHCPGAKKYDEALRKKNIANGNADLYIKTWRDDPIEKSRRICRHHPLGGTPPTPYAPPKNYTYDLLK